MNPSRRAHAPASLAEHLADVQTGAQPEALPGDGLVHHALKRDRAAHGVGRRAEGGHHAVTEPLELFACMGLHDARHASMERCKEGVGALVSESLDVPRRGD